MKRLLMTMTAAVGVCALLGSAAASAQSGTTQPGDRTTPTASAPAESGEDNQPSRSARNFVEEAAADSTAEVKLGELAQQKASNENVKEFAQHMVEDHTKANEQLMQVASQHSITPPQELKSKHQKLHDKLSKLSGDEFDREYMKAMVKDHEKAVKLFRKQAGRSEGELSQFASSTLPKLEEHLEEAKRIREELNEGARGTSGTRDRDTTGTTGTTGTGHVDDGPASPGGDDVNNPGHSEPPPSTPNPDPTERP